MGCYTVKYGTMIVTMEATNMEKEASAPLLEQIVEEYQITVFALDIDNTLLKTNEYFWERQDGCSIDLAENFLSATPSEVFVERMAYNLNLVYQEGRLLPIDQKYREALDKYFKDNHPAEYRKYIKFVKKRLADFYNTVPELIPGAEELLHYAYDRDIQQVFNSNAQDHWTRLKVNVFENILGGVSLSYNAVDICYSKDAESWRYSAEMVGGDMEHTLIFGDSLTADVLPAIEAGFKHIVWIKGDMEKLPVEIRENPDIHIWCVDSVKDLL